MTTVLGLGSQSAMYRGETRGTRILGGRKVRQEISFPGNFSRIRSLIIPRKNMWFGAELVIGPVVQCGGCRNKEADLEMCDREYLGYLPLQTLLSTHHGLPVHQRSADISGPGHTGDTGVRGTLPILAQTGCKTAPIPSEANLIVWPGQGGGRGGRGGAAMYTGNINKK